MNTTNTSSNKISFYLSLVGKALKGEQIDYTQGSLRKAILMLSIPMIIEMGMESVFALVDLFFVSRLGQHAVSTVGLTESVITLVYSLAIGLSMAATATVARRVGEKNAKGAAQAAMQAIWIGIAISAIISIAGLFLAEHILMLMGAEAETIRIGSNYVRIMFAGNIVIVLLFLINGIFRGAGDASIAMKSLTLANICNIILCPLLIDRFGLDGAAWATTIGRGIGVVYQLYHLFIGKGIIRLRRSYLNVQWTIIKSLAGIAWPATLQFIIASCSWIFLARLVAETGLSEASAGYQTAIRIVMFFLLPAWGISNAAATLVGQNLGAKEITRAEQSVLKTAKYNAVFMFVVSLFFLTGAEFLAGIFSKQTEVKIYAVQALRIISAGYIFYGVGMVMANAFNGAGDTRTPTIINFFGFWLMQIPLAYLLAKQFNLGPTGVFISIPVSETAIAIAAYILFKRGRWKTVKV
ncbi:MAG TPA: MATE family efflux transporter [Chitinophagaceae bacterium]|nr:MATE family efflux transporter [Chitinophagaceae bacterium]